ncbi:MAG TPA: hypothetical protein ENI49_06570 [Thermoplasmatales archaeon]|nr:hypothetical protein [Thermoplasmatales archaeon]
MLQKNLLQVEFYIYIMLGDILHGRYIIGLRRIIKINPSYIIFSPLANFGTELIVDRIKKWAVRKGVDVEKPLQPMDLKIEDY